MKNDYDTDLDVMFCWGYGFINDPVCSMESDGKKEPERTEENGLQEECVLRRREEDYGTGNIRKVRGA